MADLVAITHSLMTGGKGVLAADESVASATKRLALYGVPAGEEQRIAFRDLFLTAPGAEQYLSGVILFSETLGQKGSDKKLFPDSLAARGIAPGIKVDEGTEPFPDSPHELLTKGLLGLPERLAGFKKQGAQFTKWRAVVTIDGDTLPTQQAIHENMKRLAMYAKEAQSAGLVPMVEPEVVYEGKHSRARAKAVLMQTLQTLFESLGEQSVDLSGLILKTAMALSGSASAKKDTPEEVAEATVDVLLACVPKSVGGVVFLSGGQTPDQATENLAAIVQRARAGGASWPITFSYARALQEEALELWKGNPANVDLARTAFLARLEKVAGAVHI